MAQWYWDSYQFSRRIRHHHLFKHWTSRASWSVKGCEDTVQMRRAPTPFSMVSTWDSYIASFCDERRSCIQDPAGKSDHFSSQGISVSTLIEAANSGSLSHTYCWGKGNFELLVESWPTSSIESWEFTLFSRWYGIHGDTSSSCAEIGVPLDLRRLSQGISVVA